MNKEELIRNLKYEEEKHRNDFVPTFETNISAMCADVLRVLKNCIEIPEGATNGDIIMTMFPNEEMYEQTPTMTYYGMMRFDTEWWNAPYKTEK